MLRSWRSPCLPTHLQGPSAGLRSKLQAGPLLHSASASYSRSGGWQLSAKSKLSDGTKVKTSYELASDELKVQGAQLYKGWAAASVVGLLQSANQQVQAVASAPSTPSQRRCTPAAPCCTQPSTRLSR